MKSIKKYGQKNVGFGMDVARYGEIAKVYNGNWENFTAKKDSFNRKRAAPFDANSEAIAQFIADAIRVWSLLGFSPVFRKKFF